MRQAEILGFGLKGEILDLTEEKLTKWIKTILDDPRYMNSAKKLSSIFRDQQETPLERAIYWTEYVMRHKGAHHLKSPAMNLSLIQYHSIDVVSFLLAIVIVTIWFVYLIAKLIFVMITRAVVTKRMNSHVNQALKRKKNY